MSRVWGASKFKGFSVTGGGGRVRVRSTALGVHMASVGTRRSFISL